MIRKNRRIGAFTTLALFAALSVGGRSGEAQRDDQFILAGVELMFPIAAQAFDRRLARMMQVVGQSNITRTYTDSEMQMFLLDKMRQDSGSALRELDVHIRPEGLSGSFRLNYGGVSAKLRGGVILSAMDSRFHVQMRELSIDGVPVPAGVLERMDGEINKMLKGQELSLDVDEFRTGEGTVLISVKTRSKL